MRTRFKNIPVDPKVLLRKLDKSFMDLRYKLVNSCREGLAIHFGWCMEDYSEETNKHCLAYIESAHRSGLEVHYAILIDNGDSDWVYVGEIGIDAIWRDSMGGNVYYWIGESFRGNGFARAALHALKKQAKLDIPYLEMLVVRMERQNLASREVARNAGGEYIGESTEVLRARRKARVLRYHFELK